MIEYIYIVKCPNCEDEHFHFFDDAKTCAMGYISDKPIITQVEVERNDFGECTNSNDLGTVWSWEEAMKDAEGECTEAEPAKSVFTKDDLKLMADGKDPEFDDEDFFFGHDLVEDLLSEAKAAEWPEIKKLCDEIGVITGEDLRNFMEETGATYDNLLDKLKAYRAELGPDFKIKESRKPIPEGMTIEQLVEEMEENEDTVECTWCNDLFDKSECRKEVNLGWLCGRCEAAIKSRGETLTFRENNYWDFLDEDADDLKEASLSDIAAAANSEFGSAYGEDDFLVGTEDMGFFDDLETPDEVSKELYAKRGMNAFGSRKSKLGEATELHDLGNEYDGGYPTEKPELPEFDEDSDSHLRLCPECGKETFDIETGICVECGFN